MKTKLFLFCLLSLPALADTNVVWIADGLLPYVPSVTYYATNKVETNNEQGCATCDGIRRNYWALYHTLGPNCSTPYKAADERTVTTTVQKHEVLLVNWRGQNFSLTNSTLVSTEIKKLKLETKSEWKEVQ